MSTVRSLLEDIKQKEVYFVSPQQTVLEALEIMRDKRIGALLVMQGKVFKGVLSERDYCYEGELEGKAAKVTLVNSLMTPSPKVITATPSTTLEVCLMRMETHHIRHLPVVEDEKIVGIISMRDLMRGIVDWQLFMLQQFQEYISART